VLAWFLKASIAIAAPGAAVLASPAA